MKKLTALLLDLPYLVMASPVLANDQTQEIQLGPPEPWGELLFGVPELVTAAIRLILVITALIAFIFLIIGGIRWITSGGDKAGTEAARNTITAALIGLMIVFSAWAIMKLIETFFGITILTLKIPKIGG